MQVKYIILLCNNRDNIFRSNLLERRRRASLQNKNVVVDKRTGLIVCGDERQMRTYEETKAELKRIGEVIDILIAPDLERYRKGIVEKPPPREMDKVSMHNKIMIVL